MNFTLSQFCFLQNLLSKLVIYIWEYLNIQIFTDTYQIIVINTYDYNFWLGYFAPSLKGARQIFKVSFDKILINTTKLVCLKNKA